MCYSGAEQRHPSSSDKKAVLRALEKRRGHKCMQVHINGKVTVRRQGNRLRLPPIGILSPIFLLYVLPHLKELGVIAVRLRRLDLPPPPRPLPPPLLGPAASSTLSAAPLRAFEWSSEAPALFTLYRRLFSWCSRGSSSSLSVPDARPVQWGPFC